MPVANNAANAVGGSLPKWQLALAVGAPVALGLGYMYYKNSNKEKRAKGNDKTNGTTDKQLSIDADSPGKSSIEKTEVRTSSLIYFPIKKISTNVFSIFYTNFPKGLGFFCSIQKYINLAFLFQYFHYLT